MSAIRGAAQIISWRTHTARCTGLLLVWSALASCTMITPPAMMDAAARAAATPTAGGIPAAGPLVEVIWQSRGAPYPLRLPTGLALAGRSQLYVLDAGNDRVQALATTSGAGVQWGSYGRAPGQFQFRHPTDFYQPTNSSPILSGGLAVDAQGHLYVADPLNARIQKFDASGQVLAVWGGADQAGDVFHQPAGLAVDDEGAVYVADAGSHRILKLDSVGRLLFQWGSPGTDAGDLQSPMALAVDRQGQVYVADSGNARIQKFDRTGRLLTAWGGRGTGAGEFGGEVFLAVDAQGRVYASDYRNHRVQVFTSDGIFLAQWGRQGSGAGEFSYAGGIAVDGQGDIVVVDIGNSRIQQFRLRGRWPTAMPTTPTPRPVTPAPAPAAPVRPTPTER